MQIEFFMTLWGNENMPFTAFAEKTAEAGFHGIEMNLPNHQFSDKQRRDYADIARQLGLKIILQHVETVTGDFAKHKASIVDSIAKYAEAEPLFINSQTGKDFFSKAQNLQIIDALTTLSEELGIPIYHETHRSRFNYAAHISADFVGARPELKQTADFSHFCCVAETLLEDQQANLKAIIDSVYHVHARVGNQQAPQINKLNSPEHESALKAHLYWWKLIIESAQKRGLTYLSFTSEFGPSPYMPSLPVSMQPLSDQWANNVQIKEMVKRLASSI